MTLVDDMNVSSTLSREIEKPNFEDSMRHNKYFMPCYLVTAVGLLASASSFSQQLVYGTVLSVVPHMAQVQVPQNVCVDQPVTPKPTGLGAAVGALLGGVIGNAAGSGNGKTAMTVAGAVIGGLAGNVAETNGSNGGDQNAPQATQQICTTQYHPEIVQQGYDVTYDFLGVQHAAVVSQAPANGQIALLATVSPAPVAMPSGAAVPLVAAPIFAPTVETVLVGLPPGDIIVEGGNTYYFVMVNGVRERRFWMEGDRRGELLRRQEEIRQLHREEFGPRLRADEMRRAEEGKRIEEARTLATRPTFGAQTGVAPQAVQSVQQGQATQPNQVGKPSQPPLPAQAAPGTQPAVASQPTAPAKKPAQDDKKKK